MTKTPCSSPTNCQGEVRALAAEKAFNEMVVLLRKAELDCRLAVESVKNVSAVDIFEAAKTTHAQIVAERDALAADRDKFLREAEATRREVEVLRAVVRDLRREREALLYWKEEALRLAELTPCKAYA